LRKNTVKQGHTQMLEPERASAAPPARAPRPPPRCPRPHARLPKAASRLPNVTRPETPWVLHRTVRRSPARAGPTGRTPRRTVDPPRCPLSCASYHGRIFAVLHRARASPIKGRHPYLAHLSTASLPPPCPPPCASRAADVEARAIALLAAVRPRRPSSSPCWSGRCRSLPCPYRAHAGASGPAAGAGRCCQAPSPEPPCSFLWPQTNPW
jgi:hypothetical protein